MHRNLAETLAKHKNPTSVNKYIIYFFILSVFFKVENTF